MPDFSPTQIRSVYTELCKSPVFSINLRIPTDARIKKECLELYKKKNTLSDKQIIINFLQSPDDIEIGLALKKANADKFKSVVKFLKNKTQDPRNETIELVAWLINFKFDLTESVEQEDLQNEGESRSDRDEDSLKESNGEEREFDPPRDSEDLNDQEVKTQDQNSTNTINIVNGPTGKPHKSRPSFLNIFLIVIVFLLTEAGAFFLWRNYTERIGVPAADEKCMYWTGTHYEPIKCGQINGDVPVIPLDVKKLNGLRKIYLSDTLTEKSLGKVWYYGFNKQKHEFFTDSGMHPIDTVKRLRPLTSYILTKYTSNHRFLLNVITLVCGSIVVAVMFAFGVDYLIRKRRNKHAVKTD